MPSWIKRILFSIGLLFCFYPLISSIKEQVHLQNAVTTHMQDVQNLANTDVEAELEKAWEYNDYLYQSKGNFIDGTIGENITAEAYMQILDISGNGIIGSVEIPKIGVNLPIYHGTSDEVLASGVGHVEGTSFPVGGEHTRAVLTGHRGLPNSKLFTRLDEVEKGDIFYIRILTEILAYEVNAIEVIRPDEVEKLVIQEGRDLVTLFTCTPYGLNTHRLLITGERVTFVEKEYNEIEEVPASFRELVFAGIPIAFALYGLVKLMKDRRHKKGV